MFKHKFLFGKLILALFTFMSVMVFTQGSAFAATVTWDGEGGDGLFSTATNWVGDVVPSESDTLTFPAGSSVIATNDLLTNVGGFILPEDTGGFHGVTINGDFTLDGNSTVGYERQLTLNDNVTLGADVQFELEYAFSGDTLLGVGDVFVGSNGTTFDLNGHNLTLTTKNYVTLDAADLSLNYQIYVPKFEVNAGNFAGDNTTSVTAYGLEFAFGVSAADNPTLATVFNFTDSILAFEESTQLGNAVINLNNSQLYLNNSLYANPSMDITQDINFNGNLYGASFENHFGIGKSGFDFLGSFDVDFTGSVDVVKDLIIDPTVSPPWTVTFSGPLSGDGVIAVNSWQDGLTLSVASSNNTTIIPNGDYASLTSDETLTDSKASVNLLIDGFSTVAVNGTRGNVIILGGSTLGGTGTVGTVLAQALAEVAPGNSAGCLNSSDFLLSPDAIFTVELDGGTACTEYDQMRVTGTVTVSGANLVLDVGAGFTPATGKVFTIITNDGSDPVSGTFSGLAEGGTVTVDGVVYHISYVGGDGNDVTLTVNATPGAPDTGFGIIASSPYTLTVLALLSSAALFVTARAVARNRV